MGKEPSKQINNIVFFDRAGLKDFLYGENAMKEGFLQRFVSPSVIPFDHTATNVTLHVSWSRYKCLIEQVKLTAGAFAGVSLDVWQNYLISCVVNEAKVSTRRYLPSAACYTAHK
jgi:hypothetical protein